MHKYAGRAGVCIVHMYECKRRLMHCRMAAGKFMFTKYSSTTNINFNLILSRQSLCSKKEAVEDIWKIDEQPDVSDISFDVQCG